LNGHPIDAAENDFEQLARALTIALPPFLSLSLSYALLKPSFINHFCVASFAFFLIFFGWIVPDQGWRSDGKGHSDGSQSIFFMAGCFLYFLGSPESLSFFFFPF